MADDDPRRLTIDTIRVLAMDAVQKANAGHPGTAMALAPVAYLLYGELMPQPAQHGVARPRPLHPLRGPRVHPPVRGAASFRLRPHVGGPEAVPAVGVADTRSPGALHDPGVETTTGPLGQGFANGVGMAIAQRFLAERYNRPGHEEVVDYRIYAICSDGDLMKAFRRKRLDRRPPRPGQPGLRLRRQPHHHRRHDSLTSRRRTREALRGVRLARPARRQPGGPRSARGRVARRRRGDGTAVADRRAQPHRVSAPHAQDTAKAHGAPSARRRFG